MTRLHSFLVVGGLAVAALLGGCGGPPAGTPVKVSVTSTKVKLEDTDALEVIFKPQGEGKPATANGSAKDQPLPMQYAGGESGGEGAKGVLPGKYTVAVKITPYAGMGPPERANMIAEFNKSLEAAAANRTVEVTAGAEQSFAIDLDANTVTKK